MQTFKNYLNTKLYLCEMAVNYEQKQLEEIVKSAIIKYPDKVKAFLKRLSDEEIQQKLLDMDNENISNIKNIEGNKQDPFKNVLNTPTADQPENM